MIPIIMIAGLFLLYLQVEKMQKSITSGSSSSTSATKTSSVSISQGQIQGSGSTSNNTDAEITAGIQTAAKHDPDPTGISQAVLSVASQVSSLFTQAHQAAMKKEATTINQAVPTFLSEVEKVMSALGSGSITESEAISYLNQAQSDYYTTVSGIIKKSSPCVSNCTIGGKAAPSGAPAGWLYTNPNCCNTGSKCNAACCIGCYCIEPTVTNLTRIIKAGGGSYQIAPTRGGDSMIGVTAPVNITYKRPVQPTTSQTSKTSNNSELSNILTSIGNLF